MPLAGAAFVPSSLLSAPAQAYDKALNDGLSEEEALAAARAVQQAAAARPVGELLGGNDCRACKGAHRPHICGKVRSTQSPSPKPPKLVPKAVPKAVPKLVPASEPELPEQPPPANFQRVFLRLVAYWMSAEEEAMLAKAASGSVLGEETKEIGQCSFPGCVYIEKHAGEHGFDEAITLLPTPKRQKCAPTKFEIDHSVPQLAHATKHRADASSSSSVSRSRSSAGAQDSAHVMAPPPARAPSSKSSQVTSKQATARAPAVGAASSAASASAAKRKALSVSVHDGGGDGASGAHGGASSAHGGASSAHAAGGGSGSYSGSSMDADDGLPVEADSPQGSPESLVDKREVYAQAYRLAIEEGCSTLEALQRAQLAISSPLSKHAPNNPKGGGKPKAAVPVPKAPVQALAAARSTEDERSSSGSASASVPAPKPVAAVFRGGMAVTKAVAPTVSSPKASAPKAPVAKAPTAKAPSSTLCAPCASPGGAHHGAPAPQHYRRVHVRLNAWWETPDALRTWRLWAMEGLCGFPGCPLPDRHGGPHEYDDELIALAR